MRELSNLELRRLLLESEHFIGGRIQKIHRIDETMFRFKIFIPKKGTTDLICDLRRRFGPTAIAFKAPEKPDTLTMKLRKHLSGGWIRGMEQHRADRVVSIIIEKGGIHHLIIEMFSKGNLILTDSNMKIMASLRKEEWRDRKIKVGESYRFPSSDKIDPSMASPTDIIKKEGRTISLLLNTFSIGPLYAEEAIRRAGFEPKESVKIDEDMAGLLASSLCDISEKAVKHPLPRVYLRDSKPYDFSLIPLKRYEGMEKRSFKLFWEALDWFYINYSEGFREDRKGRVLQQQRGAFESLIKRAEVERKKAEWLNLHYGEVEELLSQIRNLRREGVPWEEMMSRLKTISPSLSKLVKRIDWKKGKIVIIGRIK